MATEQQMHILADVFDNVESLRSVAITINEKDQSISIQVEQLDRQWLRALLSSGPVN